MELSQLWEHHAALPPLLHTIPRGLPALLQAIPREQQALTCHLVADWPMAEPIYGLELLDSQYADRFVRAKAVEWLEKLPIDDLIDLLPQLTQVREEGKGVGVRVNLLFSPVPQV